jgi:uncharacterized membrane protein (UPF0127 family)
VARIAPFALCAALAACACACSQQRGATHVSGTPEVIFAARAGEVHVQVEVARTEPDRQRGLMFRQSLASGHGMLFIFEQPGPLKFWMKNTYIPLDMIFLDGARQVVFVEENAEPLTLGPRGPDTPTQFVIEVPGGWARTHGVETGIPVHFNNIE